MLDRRGLIAGLAALAATLPSRRSAAATDPLDPDLVLHDPEAPALRNPEGDVTVVEYFDYRCPYCRAGHPMMLEEADRDPGLRLVMKDWPVFGPDSLRAARLVLAAGAQGQYVLAHDTLMRAKGGLGGRGLPVALGAAGVDVAAAEAALAADGARIDALIARNRAQAAAFGFPGTPAYVIGFALFPGVIERRTLRDAVARARG
ncbi:DsbA family protein [Amaricoccus solimangrovi]|nr:DsbA family protein [Amaricoccus solimangrovi]